MTLTTSDQMTDTTREKHLSPRSTTAFRVRLGAGALAIAGALFVVYPALRPFSDETSLQGAAAFASTAWIVAHMLAMVGFILNTHWDSSGSISHSRTRRPNVCRSGR